MDHPNTMTVGLLKGTKIHPLHLLFDLMERTIGMINHMIDNQVSDGQLILIEIFDDTFGLLDPKSLGYGN